MNSLITLDLVSDLPNPKEHRSIFSSEKSRNNTISWNIFYNYLTDGIWNASYLFTENSRIEIGKILQQKHELMSQRLQAVVRYMIVASLDNDSDFWVTKMSAFPNIVWPYNALVDLDGLKANKDFEAKIQQMFLSLLGPEGKNILLRGKIDLWDRLMMFIISQSLRNFSRLGKDASTDTLLFSDDEIILPCRQTDYPENTDRQVRKDVEELGKISVISEYTWCRLGYPTEMLLYALQKLGFKSLELWIIKRKRQFIVKK